jgi:hypothetical protein
LPTFCLHVHLFEPEAVEGDDPVDSTITNTSDALKVLATRAIAHSMEQIENDRFKVLRSYLREHLEKLRGNSLPQF